MLGGTARDRHGTLVTVTFSALAAATTALLSITIG